MLVMLLIFYLVRNPKRIPLQNVYTGIYSRVGPGAAGWGDLFIPKGRISYHIS